jgi:hypothetical protein
MTATSGEEEEEEEEEKERERERTTTTTTQPQLHCVCHLKYTFCRPLDSAVQSGRTTRPTLATPPQISIP